MSALPLPAPSTPTDFSVMSVADLDEVVAIEKRAYSFPWTRGNFTDSLAAGYLARLLVCAEPGGSASQRRGRGGLGQPGARHCLGYYVAMPGVEEMHLLNLTVHPEHQGQGHARAMLTHLMAASQAAHAATLWLEVRRSNDRARALYQRWGFEELGVRKAYYPGPHEQREDAIVMRLPLAGPARPRQDDHALD